MAERRVYKLMRLVTIYEVVEVEARSIADAKRAADEAARAPRTSKRIEGGATRWTEIKR